MIVSIAAVPHPPLLVPELVSGGAEGTSVLRQACVAAARRLSHAARAWIAVAADPSASAVSRADGSGTFRGYGVDVVVSLAEDTRSDTVDPLMPLPALIAGWLRAQAAAERVDVRLLAPDSPIPRCREFGASIAGHPGQVGLLVLGDGSTLHPGPAGRADDRADAYDRRVSRALAAADAEALLDLDADLGTELNVGGRAAWQALAGAALAAGHRWRADLLYSQAPYGTGYHVAVWEPT
ncbi:MAG: hypothetical protein JOZ47_13210 [Kutzneria sp.]|nr:hypothetical protein [Kutzneria sp.]MBV9846015.1 hypothetical protein [Kutzneria sp.]